MASPQSHQDDDQVYQWPSQETVEPEDEESPVMAPRTVVVALPFSSSSSSSHEDEQEDAFAALESFLEGKYEKDSPGLANDAAVTEKQEPAAKKGEEQEVDQPANHNDTEPVEQEADPIVVQHHSPKQSLTNDRTDMTGNNQSKDAVAAVAKDEDGDETLDDATHNPPTQTRRHTFSATTNTTPSHHPPVTLRRSSRRRRRFDQLPKVATTNTTNKKRTVVPSQASLVGSLPQRWLKGSGPSSLVTRPKKAVKRARLGQSTPAWRRSSLTQNNTQHHATQDDDGTTTAKTPYRPFGGSVGTKQWQDVGDNLDIADVPAESMRQVTPTGWIASPAPRRGTKGPLVTAWQTARDQWQVQRLRLAQGRATTTTTTMDVTVLQEPVVTTTRRSFVRQLVYWHCEDNGDDNNNALAWCLWERPQPVGRVVRLHQAVVVPRKSFADTTTTSTTTISVPWLVGAHLVQDTSPQSSVPSYEEVCARITARVAGTGTTYA